MTIVENRPNVKERKLSHTKTVTFPVSFGENRKLVSLNFLGLMKCYEKVIAFKRQPRKIILKVNSSG